MLCNAEHENETISIRQTDRIQACKLSGESMQPQMGRERIVSEISH